MISRTIDRKIKKESRIWDVTINIRKVTMCSNLRKRKLDNAYIVDSMKNGILYQSSTPQRIKHCYFFECIPNMLNKMTIEDLFVLFETGEEYLTIVEEIVGVGYFSFEGNRYYVRHNEFGFVFDSKVYNIIGG